jgi:hypothetical protein
MSWITTDSVLDAVAITPSAALIPKTRAVYVGGTGSLIVTTANGSANISFLAVPAGSLLPLSIIAFTGGTATGVLALY